MSRLCDFSPPSAVILVQCHCEASARTGCGNPFPIPSAPLPKGGWHGEAVTGGFFSAPHLLLHSVGAGFSCPPSCQPIPGHCCGRQSGHFLEIGSLLPPLAALRRFPRRPVPQHYQAIRRGGILSRPPVHAQAPKPLAGTDASVCPRALHLTARSYNKSGPWLYRSAYTPPQIPRR